MEDVAITGLGVVSPLGTDVPEHTARLLAGDVAVVPSPWDQQGGMGPAFWAPVTGFDPTRWLDATVIDGTDVFARWAVASAAQAVEAAGLAQLDPRRTAVVHGTSMGGMRALLEAQHQLEVAGPEAVHRKTAIKIWPNMAAAQIAMRWRLHGPQLTVCTACASSIDAIGTAARMIADGRVDVAIAGGTEGGMTPEESPEGFVPATVYSGTRYGMTSKEPDRLRAAMPFDRDRGGIVTGEGSAMVVLERADLARARGATILGFVRGYGSVADSHHPSSPDPTGQWEAEAMREALDEAGIPPDQVDAVVAHATGTPVGDTAEIRALNGLFGGRRDPLPVTSLKGTLGHTGASAGAMGLMAGIEAMHRGCLAPTMGTTHPDDEIDFRVVVGRAAEVEVRTLQVNAFGFGGQDASLVVTRS